VVRYKQINSPEASPKEKPLQTIVMHPRGLIFIVPDDSKLNDPTCIRASWNNDYVSDEFVRLGIILI